MTVETTTTGASTISRERIAELTVAHTDDHLGRYLEAFEAFARDVASG